MELTLNAKAFRTALSAAILFTDKTTLPNVCIHHERRTEMATIASMCSHTCCLQSLTVGNENYITLLPPAPQHRPVIIGCMCSEAEDGMGQLLISWQDCERLIAAIPAKLDATASITLKIQVETESLYGVTAICPGGTKIFWCFQCAAFPNYAPFIEIGLENKKSQHIPQGRSFGVAVMTPIMKALKILGYTGYNMYPSEMREGICLIEPIMADYNDKPKVHVYTMPMGGTGAAETHFPGAAETHFPGAAETHFPGAAGITK